MELSVSPADVLGGFVDLKQSRINYADNTITLKFTKPFNDFIYDFDKINIPLGLTQPQYGLADIQPLMQADNSVTLPLQNLQNNADKLIRVSFIQGNKAVKATLMGVADQVNSFNPNPIVNLQDPNPIINLRTVAETKPTSAIVCSNQQGIKSACNNFFNSTENGANPSKIAVFRDTLSHRLIDFDKIVPNAQINKGTWAKTNYRKTLGGDNGRIPLLLIHGWQGDKDLRNPAKLGLWENSELQYWQHFLDYYLTSDNPDGVRNLQKKYHIYLYHYPSYKHVTYNASVLTAMLKELATKNPTSDLNQAMQTGGKGVAVLAHSMGGLVARSAIEEYQAFGANGEKLRRLITLDTPHHGSPVSQPVTWEQFQTKLAQIFIKDPYTQGASDLNWDNFNGFYAAADVNTNNQKRWDNTLAKNHAAFA
jgi:pimeloyl-ACP methyl ester carboxylesterase